MELKEYQQKAMSSVRLYLEALARWHAKNQKVIEAAGVDAALDAPAKAWTETVKTNYYSRSNGLGQKTANFCLKIPTGGGKTLLAVKTIDLIQSIYLKRRTGLVLWIVPTTQIYRQTWKALQDRAHPYRQHLDIVSGGHTLLREKTDKFTPQDVAESLVVMLLMLPAANRQNKATLKLFQDSGGFSEFVPAEDDIDGHKKLLAAVPNLDAFGASGGFYGQQVKSSLGNALRTLAPVVILDEGHKAYSDGAQATLYGFNPSLVVELSATPDASRNNILVDIPGVDLAREEMIKLDLHVSNKASSDWQVTMLESVKKLGELQKSADALEANGGPYIRPICLVQVERTGKDQRESKLIHAEAVREYLIKICGLAAEAVAVKSSERDDIEGLDLLSRDCPVRFIITKQALQEGWDCPFAYVLTILTNPASKNSLTQLVGRILRQPYARKTRVKELDESYVYCFQQKGAKLLEDIRGGFQREGLGDLAGRVITDSENKEQSAERLLTVRDKFAKFAGKIYLPVFVILDDGHWRKVSYEMDIASRVDWSKADFSKASSLTLSMVEDKDIEFTYGVSENSREAVKTKGVRHLPGGGLDIDEAFVARHLMDSITHPWVAYGAACEVLKSLLKKYDAKMVAANLVFIIESIRKCADDERDRLSMQVFADLIQSKKLRFLMLKDDPESRLPSQKKISQERKRLNRKSNDQLENSLFDFVPEDDLNTTERAVAWYLDEQEDLLWWYRNISRQDYAVQGWKKHRIYADFVFSGVDHKNAADYDRVFVVETKGIHLKNEDTKYKQDVFDVCNKLAEEKSLSELGLEFPEKKIQFKVVFSDEWQRELNNLLTPDRERAAQG
jgi:type III restriction enzyme